MSTLQATPDSLSDTITDEGFAATLAPDVALGLGATIAEGTLPLSSQTSERAFTAGRAGALLGDDDIKRALRSTILPRARVKDTHDASQLELIVEDRQRYEHVSALGEGGVGEVALVRDNDIERKVAMKRLKPGRGGTESMLRFVEEIRTIGSLEHPNIIPIHDVGVDEQGAYYFIMKHVEGETLEEIIEGLSAGKPDYHQRFTPEVRVQIFLDMLKAVAFAHNRGIIHRDIKPANVMIGAHGEVMVMDWGLAKAVNAAELPGGDEDEDEGEDTRERLFQTRHGSLVGTPAYMAPEQAQGLSDQIDTRSDTYALSALFYEFMTLEHYLGDMPSLNAMLMAIVGQKPEGASSKRNPYQPRVKAELTYYLKHGLQKAPEDRYQDAGEMVAALQMTISGKFGVHCPVTLTKRGSSEMMRLVDRFPGVMVLAVGFALVLMGFGVYGMAVAFT